MIENLSCPNCNSKRLIKAGFAWSGQNKRQRYMCLDCHRATIIPEEIKKLKKIK
jgi:DNA-directed RNA polymerase subunit RPC12/RpoP